MTLGNDTTVGGGWPAVLFMDAYDCKCSLQMSSAINSDHGLKYPGTSFLWLGIDDMKPKVMASNASKVGVQTDETTGWVPYPIPSEVLLSSRMHLDREQVAGLIERLQSWLDHGTFTGEER